MDLHPPQKNMVSYGVIVIELCWLSPRYVQLPDLEAKPSHQACGTAPEGCKATKKIIAGTSGINAGIEV